MVEVSTPRSQRKRVRRANTATIEIGIARHFWNLLAVCVIGSIVCAFLLVQRHEERVREHLDLHDSARSAEHTLASGKPFIWYGTAWKEEKTATYVEEAIEAGFRFFDTACQPAHYNEGGVGIGWTRAAAKYNLDRSEIFLQTKYSPYQTVDPPYDVEAPLDEQVRHSVQISLKNLITPYLDSLVLHSPLHNLDDTLVVWKTMESFVDDGTVKHLGLSNCYDLDQFKAIYSAARHKPFILQNRFYAKSNFDTELRQFCKSNNVLYQSFWTLTGNAKALKGLDVHQMAQERNLTPQTLLFAFLLSLGYVTPLSGTTSARHMQQDIDVMRRIQHGEAIFETEEDLRKMAKLIGMPDL